MSRALREEASGVLGNLPDGFGFVDSLGGGYDVTHVSLARVAAAIRDRDVDVVSFSSGTASGSYRAGSDVMRIRTTLQGVRRKSVIVHEAVHCLHDIRELTIARPYNEVATNIAENMYRRLVLSRGGRTVAPPPGAIDRAADAVALRLLGIDRVRRRVVRLGESDVNHLVAVLYDSSYGAKAGTTFVGDGV